jgi:hypothetical protein
MRGTPSASVGRARGPRDASGYAVHGRVTPCHMITGSSSLPISSGIKVTTPGETHAPCHLTLGMRGADRVGRGTDCGGRPGDGECHHPRCET